MAGKHWSQEDKMIVAQMYPDKSILVSDIVAKLGRTRNSIKYTAAQIGAKRRRETDVRPVTIPKDWILPAGVKPSDLRKGIKSIFYYCKDKPGQKFVKRKCSICGTSRLMCGLHRQKDQAVFNQTRLDSYCPICKDPKAVEQILTKYKGPDNLKSYILETSYPVYSAIDGRLFYLKKKDNKVLCKVFVKELQCEICEKPLLRRISSKSNLCSSCGINNSNNNYTHKLIYTAKRLMSDISSYTDYEDRDKAFIAAGKAIKPYVNNDRPTNVFTLPSAATFWADKDSIEKIVTNLGTLHWFELPLDEVPVPKGKVKRNVMASHEVDLNLLTNAARIYRSRGTDVQLHIENALKSRFTEIGFINMDLCICLKPRDLLDMEEVIKFAIPKCGILPMIVNFTIRATGNTEDYYRSFEEWRVKWNSMGYTIPLIKHFPYSGKSNMFLTAIVIKKNDPVEEIIEKCN